MSNENSGKKSIVDAACDALFSHKHTTPNYSEKGPVFHAVAYETTDECADSSRTTWAIEDLDGHRIASDCTESDARYIVHRLNTYNEIEQKR